MGQFQVSAVAHGLGELAFWVSLVALTTGVLSRPDDPRRRPIQLTALLLLGATATSYALLSLRLGRSLSLILYNALRVRLLVESWPLAYGVPLCVGLAVGLAGLLAAEAQRRQWALALLLLIAAGYAPRAPAHMLTFVLALTLTARSAFPTPAQAPAGSPS